AALSRKLRRDVVIHVHAISTRRGHPNQRERIPQSARVVEQVPDRDRLFGVGPFRNELFYFVIQRELAALDQKQNGQGRELFGNGCDGKDRSRRNRNSQLKIRHAIAVLIHKSPASTDGKTEAR